MATMILAKNERVSVAPLPTGSGKSAIAIIIAEYFRAKGKKVAIVTTETFLVTQFHSMMGPLKQELDVLSMSEALLTHEDYEVFVIDEADACLLEKGSLIDARRN